MVCICKQMRKMVVQLGPHVAMEPLPLVNQTQAQPSTSRKKVTLWIVIRMGILLNECLTVSE